MFSQTTCNTRLHLPCSNEGSRADLWVSLHIWHSSRWIQMEFIISVFVGVIYPYERLKSPSSGSSRKALAAELINSN